MMDGYNSQLFAYFKILLMSGLSVLKKHVEDFSTMLEIMMVNTDLPCFQKFSLAAFKDRFGIRLTDKDVQKFYRIFTIFYFFTFHQNS